MCSCSSPAPSPWAPHEKTGASRYYADLFLGLVSGFPPGMILGFFILMTSISTQLLSNNATAVLLLPIAIHGHPVGVDPKPFIMGSALRQRQLRDPYRLSDESPVYGPAAIGSPTT